MTPLLHLALDFLSDPLEKEVYLGEKQVRLEALKLMVASTRIAHRWERRLLILFLLGGLWTGSLFALLVLLVTRWELEGSLYFDSSSFFLFLCVIFLGLFFFWYTRQQMLIRTLGLDQMIQKTLQTSPSVQKLPKGEI